MTNKKSSKVMVPAQDGMFRPAIIRFKLIMRLLGDRRVSPWLKLIPIGSLIYLVSPIDIIMGIPGIDALDDAAILWFGSSLFVDLCPIDVVSEHMQELTSNVIDDSGDIVDAETTDVDNDQ
jgi:uncharacterized membrane protein YkvA (DUF1232 family)